MNGAACVLQTGNGCTWFGAPRGLTGPFLSRLDTAFILAVAAALWNTNLHQQYSRGGRWSRPRERMAQDGLNAGRKSDVPEDGRMSAHDVGGVMAKSLLLLPKLFVETLTLCRQFQFQLGASYKTSCKPSHGLPHLFPLQS